MLDEEQAGRLLQAQQVLEHAAGSGGARAGLSPPDKVGANPVQRGQGLSRFSYKTMLWTTRYPGPCRSTCADGPSRDCSSVSDRTLTPTSWKSPGARSKSRGSVEISGPQATAAAASPQATRSARRGASLIDGVSAGARARACPSHLRRECARLSHRPARRR